MMSQLLTLLLLAAVVRGQIEVRVTAGAGRGESSVRLAGSIVDTILDEERDTFKLSDTTLKDAIQQFHGPRPDDVFVKSPTPWSDLYRTYSWQEVTRTIKPTQSFIMDIDTETRILNTQTIVHNVSFPGDMSLTFNQSNSNSLYSTWTSKAEATTEKEINYAVSFKDVKGTGNNSIEVSVSYGEDIRGEVLSLRVGAEAVKIPLDPHQTVRAELTVKRNTMRIQVEYEVFLSGTIAVNYAVPYLGHHFYGFDIGHIIFTDRDYRRFSSSEVLMIAYLTEANVVVKDVGTGAVLFQVPVSIIPENN